MARKLTKRERILLAVVVAVAVAVVYLFYIVGPLWREMLANREQIGVMTEKVRTEMDVAFLLEKSREDDAQARAALENSAKRFNIKMNDGLFIVQLGREMEKEKVYLDAYSPGQIVPGEIYLTMPVRMLVSGNYTQVMKIIRYLEAQTAMTELRTITIRALPQVVDADGQVTAKGQVAVDLLYIVYSVQDPKGLIVLEDMKKWTYGRKNPFYDLLPPPTVPDAGGTSPEKSGDGAQLDPSLVMPPAMEIPEPFLPPL